MQDNREHDEYLQYIIASDRSKDFIEEYNLDHVPAWYQYKRMHEKSAREFSRDNFWENLDGNMPLKQLLTKMLVHAMDEVARAFK